MIILIARLTAKDGELDTLRARTLEMADAVSANEPGNTQYLVTEGAEANQIVIIEGYEDEAALDAHRQSEHFRAIGKMIGPALAAAPEIVFRLKASA